MTKILNRKAFTLIELLITMVVATVVISGVLMSLINTMVLNEYNQGFSIAMNIARAKIEEQLANRTNFDTIASIAKGTLSKATDGIDGLYKIDVSNPIINGNAVTDLKDITVYVCWRGRGGRIIGDCRNSGSALEWNSANSPCSISASIARR